MPRSALTTRRRPPWLKLRYWLVFVGLAVIALYVASFIAFTQSLPRSVADPDRHTDAIIVLTGGRLRLAEGFRLIKTGIAGEMLITGVKRGVSINNLMTIAGENDDALASKVTLGYSAEDTVGNAEEAAAWVRRENIHSIRLVTADYHMPRSLLEFAAALPEIAIAPNPVFPAGFLPWWQNRRRAAVMLLEFDKYLIAKTRIALSQKLMQISES